MNTTIKFKTFVDLVKYFSDEDKCAKHLAQLRWNGTVACPHCGGTKVYKRKAVKSYKCGESGCLSSFSVTTGTFFENTKIPLSKWFIAMYLCFSHKKGVSSCQLARDLGVTQKTAWFILHRIRSLVSQQAPQMLLTNMVEADETYVGGKHKNRHVSKRRGAWKNDKKPIVGIVERSGAVRAKYIPDVNKSRVSQYLLANIKHGTRLITDQSSYYTSSFKYYKHDAIRHDREVYVKGDIHTNTIEGFWSILKRGIYGTYHQVSEKHIQRYVDEFVYKYCTRKATEQERFDAAIRRCNGRLRYSHLIKK